MALGDIVTALFRRKARKLTTRRERYIELVRELAAKGDLSASGQEELDRILDDLRIDPSRVAVDAAIHSQASQLIAALGPGAHQWEQQKSALEAELSALQKEKAKMLAPIEEKEGELNNSIRDAHSKILVYHNKKTILDAFTVRHRLTLGEQRQGKAAHLIQCEYHEITTPQGFRSTVPVPPPGQKPVEGAKVVNMEWVRRTHNVVDLYHYTLSRCPGQTVEEYQSLLQDVAEIYAETPHLSPLLPDYQKYTQIELPSDGFGDMHARRLHQNVQRAAAGEN